MQLVRIEWIAVCCMSAILMCDVMFLINKEIKAAFTILKFIQQTIYTYGELPAKLILFALNTHLLPPLILYPSAGTCMLLL